MVRWAGELSARTMILERGAAIESQDIIVHHRTDVSRCQAALDGKGMTEVSSPD